MKYGMYSDSELPPGDYRCPSWDPMPDGKKNVVVLVHTPMVSGTTTKPIGLHIYQNITQIVCVIGIWDSRVQVETR